jgi:hypothetical protein
MGCMEDIEILKERIRVLESRLAELEEAEAGIDDESKGLKYLKEKIVRVLKDKGEIVSIHSEKVHDMAIRLRNESHRKADESRKRLREMGFLKTAPDKPND